MSCFIRPLLRSTPFKQARFFTSAPPRPRPLPIPTSTSKSRPFIPPSRILRSPKPPTHTQTRTYRSHNPNEWDPEERARLLHEGVRNAKPLFDPTGKWQRIKASPLTLPICGIIIIVPIAFYYSHIDEVPLTGRKRFNCITPAQAASLADASFQALLADYRAQNAILPDHDQRVKAVRSVMKRLVRVAEGYSVHEEDGVAESGMGDPLGGRGREVLGKMGSEWKVFVIDDPGQANAMVLPNNTVFVFTGLLPICKNADGLAVVLAHELAHNVAEHMGERISQGVIWGSILTGLMMIDFSMIFSQILGPYLVEFGVMRRASRVQEEEADLIGLLMMADACFDPNEAVSLWERMRDHYARAAEQGVKEPLELLSTHPSNDTRIRKMGEWMDRAEERRTMAGCNDTIQAHWAPFRQFYGLRESRW